MRDKFSTDLSTLTVERACQLAESLLQTSQSSGFNDLQFLVFQRSIAGFTYQEIADEAGYEYDYIKQIGSQLWQMLSRATGESVSKSNVHSVLRRFQLKQSSSGIAGQLIPTLEKAETLSTVEGQDIRWVGREDLVQTLNQKLLGTIRVLALVGITGIGKSALAIRLTLDHQVAHTWRQVKLIRCDRKDNAFEQLARQLLGSQILQSEDILKSPQQLVYALVNYLEEHAVLVILDMVEEILTSNEKGIHSYREPLFNQLFEELLKVETLRARFILTSQYQPPTIGQGRYNHHYHLERLTGLTHSEALRLFCLWDVEPTSELELNCLDRFSNAYEGHPLTLQVIAGEIRGQPYSGNVQAYWHDFGPEIETLEQELKNAQDMPGKAEYSLSGYSVNLIDLVEQRVVKSFKRLHQSHPEAHLLLCMGSVFRRSVEREGWLFLIGDTPKSRQVIAFQTLQRRFLIEEDLSCDRVLYRLHSLIRSVASQELDRLDDRD